MRRKYFLSTLQDRQDFDYDVWLAAGDDARHADPDAFLTQEMIDFQFNIFMEQVEVDDLEEAQARFTNAYRKGWHEELRNDEEFTAEVKRIKSEGQ